MLDESPRPSPRIIGAIWLAYFLLSFLGASLTQDGPMSANLLDAVTRIVDHERLYRSGVAVTLMANGLYVILSAFLYGLFAPINRSIALGAALLSLTGCIVQIVATIIQLAPIVIHGDSTVAAAYSADQIRTAMLVSLKVYRQAFSVSLPMFALFNVMLAYLIDRSRYIPRIFALLFLVAGCAWIISLWSPLAVVVQSVSLAASGLAEVGTTVWFLTKGIDLPRWRETVRGVPAFR